MTQISSAQLNAALDLFRVDESVCGDLIANTRVFVAPLYDCATLPPIFNLTTTAAVALTDEAVTVSLTGAPAGVTQLRVARGTRLYFDATTPLIVAADTVVSTTGNTTIPIEPATVVAAIAAVASVFPYAAALGISSAGLSNGFETEETGKTSQGRRTDSVVTKIKPESSGDLFFNLEDYALWAPGNIFNSMQTGNELFVYQELAGGQFGIAGRALVSTFDSTQDAQAVVTVSYTFMYQSDFVYFTPTQFNTPAAVTQAQNVRRLFGQALLSV